MPGRARAGAARTRQPAGGGPNSVPAPGRAHRVAMRPATPGAVGSGFRASGAIRAGAKAPPRIRSCTAKGSRRPPASMARNMSMRVSKLARFGLVGGRRSGRLSTGGDFRSAKGASQSRGRTRRCLIIVQSSEAAVGRPAAQGVGGQPPYARVVARKGPRRPRPLTSEGQEGPATARYRPGLPCPEPRLVVRERSLSTTPKGRERPEADVTRPRGRPAAPVRVRVGPAVASEWRHTPDRPRAGHGRGASPPRRRIIGRHLPPLAGHAAGRSTAQDRSTRRRSSPGPSSATIQASGSARVKPTTGPASRVSSTGSSRTVARRRSGYRATSWRPQPRVA